MMRDAHLCHGVASLDFNAMTPYGGAGRERLAHRPHRAVAGDDWLRFDISA